MRLGALSRLAPVATAALVAASLVSCGGGGQSTAPPADGRRSAAECTKAADIVVPPTAGTTALVVDNTASGVRGPLPPAIVAELTEAQARGDRLTIVPVDGAGQTARISRAVALDPQPGKESRTAVAARSAVLACVATWAQEPAAHPTASGSDIMAALAAASMEQPTSILVISDGLANSGEVDINRDGFDADPSRLVTALSANKALVPTLKGKPIVWAGLGRSQLALRPSLMVSLQALWAAVLTKAGARATFDTRAGDNTSNAPAADLPADAVTIPDAVRQVTSCGTEVTVPAALLFTPGSDRLQAGTEDLLQQVATDLKANVSWTAVVAGHTANYGSASSRQSLSRSRAGAVVSALERMQIPGSRLMAKGYGSTRPAVPEFSGSRHDEAAAAKNRRVVITMGPRGCAS